MAKSHLRVVAPTEVKRTVSPRRQKNAELRTREHLTPDGVEALTEAARGNRYGHRDATMILLTYRHGLRVAEVCDLRRTRSARCCTSAGRARVHTRRSWARGRHSRTRQKSPARSGVSRRETKRLRGITSSRLVLDY
jgi:site-specific recombinase XerC